MTGKDQVRRYRISGAKLATALAVPCLIACVSQQAGGPQPPSLALTPDESWFECRARFDCVVVYDANVCAERAVNSRHALEYETWGSEPRAVCRNSLYEIAESNLDALIEYTR